MQKTLTVMAAGMGSRFGGLKQAAKFGGKAIVDFAVEDARAAGFDKLVFVVRSDMEKIFREDVSGKYEKLMDVEYVFQDKSGQPLPAGRVKPWGTGHAILSCADKISETFLAVNADDYYGSGVYAQSAEFLDAGTRDVCALAGYKLENTLSKNGGVSRGVCEVDADMMLENVSEFTGLQANSSGSINSNEGRIFTGKEFVSLNFWSFENGFMQILGEYFEDFLRENSKSEKAEFYLPAAVDRAIKQGRIRAKVLPTDEKWQGVTYREDMPAVESFLRSKGRV